MLDVRLARRRARALALVASLNEVQQAHYSRHAAERFRLPELRAHAARERAAGDQLLRHWAPEATPELWRQTASCLDALNAAMFDLLCSRGGRDDRPLLAGLVTRGGEWRAFVENLKKPQWLMPKSVY